MRVRGVLGVSVVAAVLVAAGCSPDEPDSPPTSSAPTTSAGTQSSTATATATPTVAVPELPEAATVGDAAGAEAFVQHWVEVLNYAYATGDTESLESLSMTRCEFCTDMASSIDSVYQQGGRIDGGEAVVDLVRSPPPDSDGVVVVSTQYSQDASTDIAEDGSTSEVPAVERQNTGFVLDYIDGAWSVVGVGSE